ncbi:MAG: DUF3638 domain-containing protein, partial [Parachlamydiaceae bacterium]|nr:DUF3638 domain-containing protein [Parachlamydiaceae bacterium]
FARLTEKSNVIFIGKPKNHKVEIIGRIKIPNIPNESEFDQYEFKFIDNYLKQNSLNPKNLTRNEAVAEAFCDWYGDQMPAHFCAIRRQLLIATSFQYKKPLKFTRGRLINTPYDKNYGIYLKNGSFTQEVEENWLDSKLSEIFSVRKEDTNKQPSETDIMDGGYEEWEKNLRLMVNEWDGSRSEKYREQQIVKCLAYFSDHLKTLSDLNRRLVLRQLIFESNYLETLLDYNPYFGEQLLQFAESGEKLFQERNDIAAVAFFIELGRDLDNLLYLEGLKNELIDYRRRILTILGIESNQALANWQPAPSFSAQKLTYLYAQLAASYESHPPKNFTVKDAILFLTAMMHNNFHPLPIHAKSDRLCDQMHSASQRWKLKIQELLQSDSVSFICRTILNTLIPEAGSQHFHCIRYPLCVTSDNEYSLNAQSFEIFKNNQVLTGLPQKILQDKQFQKFFKNEKYQCSKINTNCYQFTDERGNLIQILTGDSYKNKIRQNILGMWYELASPAEGSHLTHYMPEDFHRISSVQGVWLPLLLEEDKSIAVICNDDLSIAYFIHLLKSKIENEKTYYSVDKVRKICPKDLPLYLVDLKEIKNKALEKLLNTAMLWSDQNGILKDLEIPSLELSFNFSVDKTGGYRAECNEHPGFFISQNQTYRGIKYIPRSIVLENEKGLRKLALPYGIVSAVSRGIIQQGALSTHTEIKSTRSIIIDLDKKSHLIAKDREQKLYLANLLFVQKKYQSAQQIIRQSQSLIIPFNEQEKELLIWIIINQNQDVSPHGLAVALSALALLPIDSFVGGSAKEIEQASTITNELKRLKSEYSKFSGSRFIIPHLNLTAKERLSIFEKIPDLSKTDQFSREEIQFPPVKKISKKLPFYFERVFASKSELNEDQKKLDQFIITRHVETQLIQWLEYAKGDPLKLELILIGVEHNPKIPAEVSVLLRSVGLGFKCNLDNLRQIQAQKDRRAFLELISEAQKFLNRHERVEGHGKGDVSLKGKRAKRSSRGINKQTITVANEKTEYHLPFPLTPRQSVLPNKILEEIFTPKSNSGLRLSREEIDALNKVVLTDSNPENVALAEHIEGYWRQDLHEKKHHYLKPEMQEKAFGLLKVQSAELAKQVNVQEKELLAFANALPTTLHDGLILQLEKMGQIRQEVTVRDLILFTARSRHFCLQGKNPYLKGKEKELLDRCLKFLDLKAQQQQTERAILMLNKLKFLDNTSCTYSQLSETLFAEITRQCPYKPQQNPELLVFEVVEEIGLHDWQVKDLERLLNPKLNENRNVILEKVMGSGKTKVYLSLLALGKADGDHLSIVVVHPSQLEGVGKAMQIQGDQLFGQVAHPFNFSRDTDTSLPALGKLLLECQEVRTNRHSYVATDKAIHSLGLAFDEMWHTYLASPEDNPGLEARLEKMRDIINLFRIKGKATLDEADLLLNCRYEVIYALGEAQPLAEDHAALVADLYQSIHPILAKLQTFTHEGYAKIKPLLIDTFTREVAVKMIPDCKIDLVISYLKGEKAGADYVSSLSEKERHLMAIAFYEFKELLPIVLEKRCGEHYGYSDNIKKILPVPYVASGIPSATSEFSFPYAQLNYTMQTLIHEGITPRILKSVISELQIGAEYERQLSVGMSLKETHGYKEFLNICGNALNTPFLDCTNEDLDALAAAYKQDHNKIYPFAKKYLFPEVKLHELKLSSSPFSLYNMFLEVQGFTGTPYNSATYPLGIETIRDPNSAGKTQGIIWKNSQKVHVLASVAFDDVIAEVGVLIGDGGYGAFIDVGALFNGIDNQRVAECILSYLPKESYRGVLFYKDNQPYVMESGKKDLIAYEKYDSTHALFILYDQYHTTGTDFVIQGKSLLSFGKNTSMRDLEQGYMRDRQAALGERVEFILSVESEAFCRSSVKLDLK